MFPIHDAGTVSTYATTVVPEGRVTLKDMVISFRSVNIELLRVIVIYLGPSNLRKGNRVRWERVRE